MKEINDEIKLTLSLMQSNIDDGAHGELQSHLYSLLEIKRNELQQRLAERSWTEPVTHDQAPYKSVKLDGQVEANPLTAEELKAGGWWCADVSEDCANAFDSKGLQVFNARGWENGVRSDSWCMIYDGEIIRSLHATGDKKTNPPHR